jgi:hypothetical protein
VNPNDAGVDPDNAPKDAGVNPDDIGVDPNDMDEEADLGGAMEGDVAREMDERYGARSGQYALHPCCKPREPTDYSDLLVMSGGGTLSTPQMSMNRGIRVFGEAGVEAVRKEMQQLHDQKVMEARKSTELTPSQRREALDYLMFLKRKRCGKIKGRGCADGRKQRRYITREDASSPTVATEAVFLTAVIDALEGREVAVIDVPGAFMQVDMDEIVHVHLTGKMVDLLLEIDPDMYWQHITVEKGVRVLYVELLKALYGTIRAA